MFIPDYIMERLKVMTVDEQKDFLRKNTLMVKSASEYLGISKQSLIRWHALGKLVPDLVLDDGYRFYFKWSLDAFKEKNKDKLKDMRIIRNKKTARKSTMR
jgi:hypothetical protein